MSDVRDEYGHQDPWGDFEGEVMPVVPDHLYCGPHESIEDVILLTETVIDFEVWASDFRCEDVMTSHILISRWEQDSPFSELKSIELSTTFKEEP